MSYNIKFIFILLCITTLTNCKVIKKNEKVLFVNQVINDSIIWHDKDIIEDTIPGISLEKAYRELIKDKKGKEIIVAVIDTEIDINHVDIKDQLWVNEDEIPDNKIDDDKNGYVDDIQGWNFLGNREGESTIYANYECARMIRQYKTLIDEGNIHTDVSKYDLYSLASSEYEEKNDIATKKLKFIEERVIGRYNKAKMALKEYFPDNNFTYKGLEKIDTINTNLGKHVDMIRTVLDYDYSEQEMEDDLEKRKLPFKYYLNLAYEDREIIGDDPDNISDKIYGNNNVYRNAEKLYHGTVVSGALVATRNDGVGINGFSNRIKIMPLSVSCYGDEYDKDIALAIRYAVDNGAEIINMTSNKTLSMHKEWVTEALEYAVKKDVLFVSSAGNDGRELNDEFYKYPSPKANPGKGVEDIFILVGSSGATLDQKLKARSSNYGKNAVDVFAPGVDIYTTKFGDNYGKVSGTSMAAPMVSGIAALLLSYYPHLSAKEVKQIIMESGVSYDVDIEIKQEDGTKKLVPFSELSKSGKIVNAYYALLMAEQVFKNKQ